MPTYRAVVEYDGTDFAGFQVQRDGVRTVGGILEETLTALFGEPVKLSSAGRTDAGVHATGQVVSFRAGLAFPADRLPFALNAVLPGDVSVRYAEVAPDDFSARFDALTRTYRYRILNRPQPSAALRRCAHHVWKPIDPDLVRRAAADLLGERDFVAFCGVLPERGGTLRRLDAVAIERSGERVELRLVGSGFLHRMVRILTGTLVEIGTGRRPPDDIPRILASRDRREAGYTAPAAGLTLVGVRYPDFDSEAV